MTPGVGDVKTAFQDVDPDVVTLTVVLFVDAVGVELETACVASVYNTLPSQVALSYSVNDTLPVHVVAFATVMVAESFGSHVCAVAVDDWQLPKLPRTKSFNVAVVDVEERVSEATLEKHSPARPSVERLTPPS
jgi:hypothetical protein